MATDDILLVPAGNKLYEKPVRIIPVYLVKLEDHSLSTKASHFVATKIDESSTAYLKMVGFEIKKDINKIGENYQEVLSSTDKSLYMELVVPWHRVIKVQNLIFRQK